MILAKKKRSIKIFETEIYFSYIFFLLFCVIFCSIWCWFPFGTFFWIFFLFLLFKSCNQIWTVQVLFRFPCVLWTIINNIFILILNYSTKYIRQTVWKKHTSSLSTFWELYVHLYIYKLVFKKKTLTDCQYKRIKLPINLS